jgi:ABC-2 type transport system ATP-binding protein
MMCECNGRVSARPTRPLGKMSARTRSRPDVLLLDEPASGPDPRSSIELRGILRDLAARGKGVLVSSHVLAELDEMADRAVVVARGRTVAVEVLSTGSATAPARSQGADADGAGPTVPIGAVRRLRAPARTLPRGTRVA